MSGYPSNLVLRPLEGWPHQFTKGRRVAPFTASWSTTNVQLGAELRHLGATRDRPAVMQLAIDEAQFRRDGMPRADAKPTHPGVIVNIQSAQGTLSFPCDTFTRWPDNLRAIALALEALRKVDRYGVTQTGQQYRGWLAIDAKPAGSAVEAAYALLCTIAGTDRITSGSLLVRNARKLAHPDVNNGDRAQWERVEAAVGVLRRAGRI